MMVTTPCAPRLVPPPHGPAGRSQAPGVGHAWRQRRGAGQRWRPWKHRDARPLTSHRAPKRPESPGVSRGPQQSATQNKTTAGADCCSECRITQGGGGKGQSTEALKGSGLYGGGKGSVSRRPKTSLHSQT